ncbi:MAG: PH domain-containing protein [Saccharofermentanales bacterium]
MQETEQNVNAEHGAPIIKERKRWLFFGLPFTFTTYTLGSKSLTLRRGLFTSTEDDILLFRIMDISVRRTLMQKIVGLGTLTVMSTDKSNPELEVKNIKNVRTFKEVLGERVEKERLRMRFRTGELMGSEFDDDDNSQAN